MFTSGGLVAGSDRNPFARRRGSTRPNRTAIRPITPSNPSGHRPGFRQWPAATGRSLPAVTNGHDQPVAAQRISLREVGPLRPLGVNDELPVGIDIQHDKRRVHPISSSGVD